MTIQKLYKYFGSKSFTYKKAIRKISDFKATMIRAMHNANVVRLENRNKRATGMSKKNPSVWVFTTEALWVLQEMYGDK